MNENFSAKQGAVTKPSANDILSSMQTVAPGESPLDFINKNLKPAPSAPNQPIDPVPVARPEPQAVPVPSPSFDHTTTSLTEMLPEELFHSPALDAPIESPESVPVNPEADVKDTPADTDPEAVTTEPQGEEEIPEDEKFSPEQKSSFGKLRRKYYETKKQFQTVQSELDNTRAELTKYQSGEVVPDKLREYEERVASLESYEKLHAFKLSPEYRQRYAEPLENLKNEARQLAQEYEVDAGIFDVALRLESKKDLNVFLKKHLKDDVAALEARDIIQRIQHLGTEMHQAEQAPAETFAQLQREALEREQLQQKQTIDKLQTVTRTAWGSAIQELRGTNKFPELVVDPTDEKHNSISKPLLESSASEYGKIVKALVANGLREMPVEVAKVLSKYVLLGRVASVTAASREAYAMHAEELEKNTQRTNGMIRPQIGGSMPGQTVTSQERKPNSLEEAVALHAQKHLR